ncbi:hypothetical protein IM40_04170 [Candidatus Paracaedimonas acanthamoebae]|nr:hypothetical protein IM40_04170 [Candidatus Paracaedimonas acanthamoebae]
MKKNRIHTVLVSSLALSISLLSAPHANAGVFDHLKKIAQTAAKIATNKEVQTAVLATGTAAYAAVKAKKAESKEEEAMAAE